MYDAQSIYSLKEAVLQHWLLVYHEVYLRTSCGCENIDSVHISMCYHPRSPTVSVGFL